MARVLILTAHPWQVAHELTMERLAVTPSSGAANALNVPFLPLEALLQTTPATGAQLRAALRYALQLHPCGVPRPALLELMSEIASLKSEVRTSLLNENVSFAGLYRAFHSKLVEDGLSHPADFSAGSIRQDRLLVYGFLNLSEDQLALIDASALDGSVMVLPKGNASFFASIEAMSQFLTARGWTIDTRTETVNGPGQALAARFAYRDTENAPGISAYVTSDRFDEVKHTLGVIRLQKKGETLPDAAIVVPDPQEYASALRAIAWEYDLPLNFNMQRRFRETRLGAWLGELFQALNGDWSFEHLLTLLGHPIAGGLATTTLRIAHQRRPSTQAAWVDIGIPRFLSDWPREASVHDYAKQLLAHLDVLHADALSEEDFDAGAGLVDLLASTPQTDPVSLQAFTDLALQTLDEPMPESELEVLGVPVLTPSDVQGGRYEHVFILGLSEGVMPAPLTEPALLDFYERRRLRAAGFPVRTALDFVHTRERDFWATLEAASNSITLSYPSYADNRPQSPSSYFARLSLVPQPAQPGHAVSPEEILIQNLLKQAADTPEIQHVQRAVEAERSRKAGRLDVFNGVTGQPRKIDQHPFSATQLTRYGQCPYRWYAQHVLSLQEKTSSDTELLPHERGELYHRVLELAVEGAAHLPDPRASIQGNIDGAFDRATKELGLNRRTAWERQAGEHLDRLRQSVQDDAFMPAGQQVLATEQKFDLQWHGLRVTGQIDRIDRTVDGHLIITDYKSSSSKPHGAKDSEGKARLDVQLPLYLEVAAQLYPGATQVTGTYLSLTRREGRTLGQATLDPQALISLTDQVKASMSAGHFPVEPDVHLHACTYCSYRTLCRRGNDLGEVGEENEY